jgi:hypothetical protein
MKADWEYVAPESIPIVIAFIVFITWIFFFRKKKKKSNGGK